MRLAKGMRIVENRFLKDDSLRDRRPRREDGEVVWSSTSICSSSLLNASVDPRAESSSDDLPEDKPSMLDRADSTVGG